MANAPTSHLPSKAAQVKPGSWMLNNDLWHEVVGISEAQDFTGANTLVFSTDRGLLTAYPTDEVHVGADAVRGEFFSGEEILTISWAGPFIEAWSANIARWDGEARLGSFNFGLMIFQDGARYTLRFAFRTPCCGATLSGWGVNLHCTKCGRKDPTFDLGMVTDYPFYVESEDGWKATATMREFVLGYLKPYALDPLTEEMLTGLVLDSLRLLMAQDKPFMAGAVAL